MLQVRTPYYVNSRTLVSGEVQVNIDLYVWTGDKVTDKPADPNYEFEMIRPADDITILSKDISPMIRDFFINEEVSLFQTSQTTQNQSVWAQWDVTVVDDTGADVDTTSSDVIDAVEGYTLYMDNVNFEPSTDGLILVSSECKKIYDEGLLISPISVNGITEIKYYFDNVLQNTIQVIPTNIDLDQSSEQIYYLNIDVSNANVDEVRVDTIDTTRVDSKTFKVVCENKFEPVNIVFKNKLGVYENVYLFKKPKTSIQNKSEMFKTGISNGQTYNTSLGQYRKYNVQGKETIKAMTGYVSECFNQTLEQLMLSEKIFIQTDSQLIPVNIKTENVEFLTQLADQKINYELEFEYAFDKINTM